MTVVEFLNNSDLRSVDARILLQHVAGLSQADIISHPEKELSIEQSKALLQFTEKRKSGLPIEYIVQKKDFYKDCFTVFEGVLIPQPDTEILVEQAIQTALESEKTSYRILDLCSGSGCIGISVAKEIANHFKDFEVFFSDISPRAIECTSINARALLKGINYTIVQDDLFKGLQNQKFDLILTNPPYIATSVIPALESDVRHEPVLALDGGPSGLELISSILDQFDKYINNGGYLFMEIGYDQGSNVYKLFTGHNLKEVNVIKDLGNRDRVVKGRY